MRIGRVAHVGAVVLSVSASVISYELLVKHVGGTAAAGWFEAGCTDDPAPGEANCAAVLASPYSYFPPKKSAQPDGQPRLPVALLGLSYYSALSLWFLGVGRVSADRRWWHAAVLLAIGFGLAMSAYFTWIMFRMLDQWCPWCMATHVLNVLIAVCAILMWPGRPHRGAPAQQEPCPPGASPAAPSGAVAVHHPTWRLALVTLLAIFAVWFGELCLMGLKSWKRQAEACIEAVKRGKPDSDTLFRHWQVGRVRNIALRADDPVRTGGQSGRPTLDVIVFSDFECPSCAKFASFVEEQVQPLFEGSLKVIFKHYPLDKACNDRVIQTVHHHACEGVRLVEGARMVGGNAGFWRAHDFVYKNRDALAAGSLTAQMVAAAIGVDEGALATAAQSEQIRQRVAEDAEQAKLAEIRGTPAVFVEGKLVETLTVPEIGFWDKVADMYWQRIGVPRPPSTRLKSPPTPSTPSRKDGP